MLGLNLKNKGILEIKSKLVQTSILVIVSFIMSACGSKSGTTATVKDDATTLTTTIDDCKKKTDLTARQYCLNTEYRKRIDECYDKDTVSKRTECVNAVVDKFGLSGSNYNQYYNFSAYDRSIDPFYLSRANLNAVYGVNYFAADPWTYYLDNSSYYDTYYYY